MSKATAMTRLRQLDDKLYRQLFGRPWHLRLQLFGAAALVAGGVAGMVIGKVEWLIYAALAALYVVLILRRRPTK